MYDGDAAGTTWGRHAASMLCRTSGASAPRTMSEFRETRSRRVTAKRKAHRGKRRSWVRRRRTSSTEQLSGELYTSRLIPIILLAGGVLLQLLTAVTGVITARILGVEGRGEVALVAAVAALFAQLTLGGSLPTAIAQTLAASSTTARDGLRPFRRRLLLWGAACSIVAGGYLAAVGRHYSPRLLAAMAITAGILTAQTMLAKVFIACLQGEGNIGRLMTGALLPQVLLTVGLTAVWVLQRHAGTTEVLVVLVIGNTVAVALVPPMLKPARPRSNPPLEWTELRRITARNYVSSIGPIDGLGLDRNIVGAVMGATSLGLYAVATAVANLSSIAGGALGAILLAKVAATRAAGRSDVRTVIAWLTLSAAATAFIVLSVEAVLPEIIRYAFGSAFSPALSTARWLVLADGLLGFRRTIIAVLQARHLGHHASLIEIVLAVAAVAGIAVEAYARSLVGVAQVLALAGLLSCVLLLVSVIRSSATPDPDPGTEPALV